MAETDKPFGVNLMLMNPEADEIARIIAEEKVKVVTTGAGNPAKYMQMWNEKLQEVSQTMFRLMVAASHPLLPHSC